MSVDHGSQRQMLLLGAAVTCIAVLYLAATASGPASIPVAELPEHEGEDVQVTGLVVHVERYDRAASFLLRDGNVSTRVFAPDGTTARPGDRVQVTGTVQRYEGRLEIVAEKTVLLEPAGDVVPLPVLAERYTTYLDGTVATTGTVADVHPGSFRLIDGSHGITVRHPNETCNITAGGKVTVTATLRYDPESVCFYLSIERDVHGVEERG